MNGKIVGVAIAFLIVVRVTQGVWEFYWANNLKKRFVRLAFIFNILTL
jgi:hypothetical protein